MHPLDWRIIRAWNGSQHRSFEELCCQLARTETTHLPTGSRFARRGTPDGGVECHWKLPTGELWGWQAKFVTESPRTKLWDELDVSVRTALERNPTLSRYTVCLPQALPDQRRAGTKSARQRWDEHVTKWSAWAQGRLQKVEFTLWDESILLEFLMKPEHTGRRAFWFGGPAFSQKWFSDNGVRPAVQQANKRYSPLLHVDLPIQVALTLLARTEAFAGALRAKATAIRGAMEDCGGSFLRSVSNAGLAGLNAGLEELAKVISLWPAAGASTFDAEEARQTILKAMRMVRTVATEMEGRQDQSKEDRRYDAGRLWQFLEVLSETTAFLESPEVLGALSGRLFVIGEAGSGKTHLFCKAAEESVQASRPAILLLGEQFDPGVEPWTRIIQLMGQSYARDEFVGALDAAGESAGCRTLIMLDGLNEGPGMAYWRRHLGAMLAHLKPFPHVVLALSIRDAYQEDLRKVVGQVPACISHPGFRGKAGEAARHFFRHYQLPEPNMPVLDPEYENPLFLKLLCESLSRHHRPRLSDPPSFRELLQMVLDDANDRLAVELDYDPSERCVQRAIARVAELMRQEGSDRVSWALVKLELDKLKPANGYSRSLAQRLIAEDLLVRVPAFSHDQSEEQVRFAYQRFSDFVLVEDWFRQGRASGGDGAALLQKWEEETEWNPSAMTWLEAAATISPEIGGPELPELIPTAFKSSALRAAFLHSIVWRPQRSITEATELYVRSLLKLKDDIDARAEAFNSLLAVAARPGHPLNADWLDRFLRPLPMPERDSIWSTAIFGGWKSERNVHRIIEWAWQENVAEGVSHEIIRLSSLALTWLLTTSDRFVRDRATKALVSLLENKLEVLRWLLSHFAGVPEPYLQERLFSVAYGCALRTTDTKELGCLAQEVYDRIFRAGAPPPSILLRDHARGVVEAAKRKGLGLDYEERKIVPPHLSEPPSEPPSIEELERAFHYRDWQETGHRSSSAIFHSMTAHDFNWYTVDDVHHWSGELGGVTLRQSPRKLFRALLERLTQDQAELVQKLADYYARTNERRAKESDKISLPLRIELIEQALPMLIGKPRARLLLNRLKPYLRDRSANAFDKHFDKQLFVRLILQRILDYGWRSELFGEFDSQVSAEGRSTRKPERIGKKYQWMAYDELHARISDNYGLADDETPVMSEREWEAGLWPTWHRDIDPSLLIRSTQADAWGSNHSNWWTPHRYAAWHSKPSPIEWLKSLDDVPAPEDFLLLHDQTDEEWLLLDGFHLWKRKFDNQETWIPEQDSQQFHLIFRSYLVRTEHLEDILRWGRRQNWINNRLPEPAHFFHTHLHEHFRSPLFDSSVDEDSIKDWRRADALPHPIIPTSVEYLCEHNVYDCSLDDTVRLALPSRWLSQKASIHVSGRNGEFVGADGKLIAYDPSTREQGHSVLVFRKAALLSTLESEGMSIFWTLLGEKNIYPPQIHDSAWLGRLTLLGIYSWQNEGLIGNLRTEFRSGHG